MRLTRGAFRTIAGAYALLTGAAILGLLAIGLLLYSVVASSGFFARSGQLGFIGMFAVLAMLTLTSAGLTIVSSER